jgi:hypothetical protein
VSARGWAYVLEGEGLIHKGDIDTAERLINDCRKNGDLPLDICGQDSKRATQNVEKLNNPDPEKRAEELVAFINEAEKYYRPFSFWDDQEYYLQIGVEKIDLKNLFLRVCEPFRIPIANFGGWADLHVRADFMERYRDMEAEGKKCVLLWCGDFDPGGLHISDFLRSNLADMAQAVDWSPHNLIIDRFGLDHDFIVANGLVWIENLRSGSKTIKVGLDHRDHPDHHKPYVQDYLRRYGARKVEANALLKVPERGRALCLGAILKYVDEDAPDEYEAALRAPRAQLREHISRLLSGSAS